MIPSSTEARRLYYLKQFEAVQSDCNNRTSRSNNLYNQICFNLLRKKQSMENVLIVEQKDNWM
ncbi:protein of unknown function [Candidatus Nitrosocosmicus franklandus]|uniref:Uncharacterized protein n=1 Tax=Candidatus Nitrosocosmicus franklandianus TaxID=1798806 RepID=A0A484I8Q2_9ARCH|nr:protein of unknown function [Candidatus Nitrosocosmicus franklandus]